jgi:multidrug efflux pump subunit AcrA (membrane-fusion protein)
MMMAYGARTVLLPARAVTVVPVVAKRTAAITSNLPAFAAAGWLEPDPHPTQITALADGVVAKVHVLEGQRVQQNDPIVDLVADDAQLNLLRVQSLVAQREAEVLIAAATWEEAKLEQQHLVERQRMVAIASAKVEEVRAQQGQLEAELISAQARHALVADQHQRLVAIHQRDADAVSNSDREQARLKLAVEAAQLAAIAMQRAVLQARHDQALADLGAARLQLELQIKERSAVATAAATHARALAMLDEARALHEQAKLTRERMRVLAPTHGVILGHVVGPGTKLMLAMDDVRSALVANLYDPARLQVRVDVPIADVARVGLAMRARIVVETLPHRQFAGQVSRIVHEANIAKNTIEVKVAILDPDPALKPEMLARVEFIRPQTTAVDSERERLFIPTQLIGRHGASPFVWLARGDGEPPQKREITLGSPMESGYIEAEGLLPGDRIVATDPAALDAHTRLRLLGEALQIR